MSIFFTNNPPKPACIFKCANHCKEVKNMKKKEMIRKEHYSIGFKKVLYLCRQLINEFNVSLN